MFVLKGIKIKVVILLKLTSPQRKTLPKTNKKGEKHTPKIKQMCINDGICAKEANRKHKTTKRQPVKRLSSVAHRLVIHWSLEAILHPGSSIPMMTMTKTPSRRRSELESVHDFVAPAPHVQTALPVQTMPNLNWRAPPNSVFSSAAAAAQPAMLVIQLRSVQRSQQNGGEWAPETRRMLPHQPFLFQSMQLPPMSVKNG